MPDQHHRQSGALSSGRPDSNDYFEQPEKERTSLDLGALLTSRHTGPPADVITAEGLEVETPRVEDDDDDIDPDDDEEEDD